jgi:hypothetical protein
MNRNWKGAAIMALSFAALTNCSGGEGPGACPAGSETCACYGNGTCDPNLECRSQLCVASSASGGNEQGSSGGAGTGGHDSSSGGVSTGGQMASSGGTSSGGSESGSGGNESGGSTSCGDTSSDPNNCGSCGHVCQGSKCESGQCSPYPGACIAKTDGFSTCTAYCASVSQSCVTGGCAGAKTAFVWPSDQKGYCEADYGTSSGASIEDCEHAINFSAGTFYWRCCCTDS